MAVTWGEPETVAGGRQGWQTDAAEVAPIDTLMADFLAAFATKGDGYTRKVEGFTYKPFEGKGANKVPFAVRVADRVNKRAADEKVAVHARSINSHLHLVVGVKPIVTRTRKPSESPAESPAEAASGEEAHQG
jgi:hypothetical protein